MQYKPTVQETEFLARKAITHLNQIGSRIQDKIEFWEAIKTLILNTSGVTIDPESLPAYTIKQLEQMRES